MKLNNNLTKVAAVVLCGTIGSMGCFVSAAQNVPESPVGNQAVSKKDHNKKEEGMSLKGKLMIAACAGFTLYNGKRGVDWCANKYYGYDCLNAFAENRHAIRGDKSTALEFINLVRGAIAYACLDEKGEIKQGIDVGTFKDEMDFIKAKFKNRDKNKKCAKFLVVYSQCKIGKPDQLSILNYEHMATETAVTSILALADFFYWGINMDKKTNELNSNTGTNSHKVELNILNWFSEKTLSKSKEAQSKNNFEHVLIEAMKINMGEYVRGELN